MTSAHLWIWKSDQTSASPCTSRRVPLKTSVFPSMAVRPPVPTKFLGQIVGELLSTSKRQTAKMLASTLDQALSRIDISPMRGDFKVWIYQNFLTPSLFFHLAINNVSSQIKKLQSKVTRSLKKWLRIFYSLTSLPPPGAQPALSPTLNRESKDEVPQYNIIPSYIKAPKICYSLTSLPPPGAQPALSPTLNRESEDEVP